jgi:hypothetical protein
MTACSTVLNNPAGPANSRLAAETKPSAVAGAVFALACPSVVDQPHSGQNFALSGIAVPHFMQNILFLLSF